MNKPDILTDDERLNLLLEIKVAANKIEHEMWEIETGKRERIETETDFIKKAAEAIEKNTIKLQKNGLARKERKNAER